MEDGFSSEYLFEGLVENGVGVETEDVLDSGRGVGNDKAGVHFPYPVREVFYEVTVFALLCFVESCKLSFFKRFFLKFLD